MKENEPKWIDLYAKSLHQAFLNMVPSRWSSLNGFASFASLDGTFLDHIYVLLKKHAEMGTTPVQLFKLFVHPSSLRSSIVYLILEYQFIKDKEAYKEKARFVLDTLNGALEMGMKEDMWAHDSNKIHSQSEINEIIAKAKWNAYDSKNPSNTVARDAARLYTSLASLGFALYRDFFPQEAHELFGPYDASAANFASEADTKMIIKFFPKIKPTEIWPQVAEFPWKEIKIYHITKDIGFRCEFIGMHSVYSKPVLENTLAVAVEADGVFLNPDEIKQAAKTIGEYATKYSHLTEGLSINEYKMKFLEWECYQFVKVFEAAGLDWRPTKEMQKTILSADIPMGMTIDSFPSYEIYTASPDYEVYWLKELYSEPRP